MSKKSSTGISTNALPVDSFLDFHGETIGQQLSLTFSNSSYGETNWVYTSQAGFLTNQLYYSNVVGTNITFPVPITAGGITFTSTGTNWIRESFALTNDRAVLLKNYSDSVFSEAIIYLRFSKLTNLYSAQSKDHIRFLNNPYAIPQLGITVGEDVTPTFGIHSGGGGTAPSSVFSAPVETLLRLELVQDNTNNFAYTRVTYATNGALIGTSITYSNSINSVQNWLEIAAGYFSLAGCTGVLDRAAISLNHSFVNTNRPPWLPNAPSIVNVSQTGDGQVTLNVVDNNDKLNYYHVDIWNSGTWTNNITNFVAGATNVVISGLSGGSNYNFRAYATGPLVTDVPSAKVESGTITLSSAVWYDSISYASIDGTEIQSQVYENLAVPITVSANGNATKIRVAIGNVNILQGFKVALFDSSRNFVVGLTTTLIILDSNTLKEFTIATTAITTGTYYIGWTAFSTITTYGSKSGTTGTERHFSNTGFDYAAYPPANLGASEGTLETISAGLLVQ